MRAWLASQSLGPLRSLRLGIRDIPQNNEAECLVLPGILKDRSRFPSCPFTPLEPQSPTCFAYPMAAEPITYLAIKYPAPICERCGQTMLTVTIVHGRLTTELLEVTSYRCQRCGDTPSAIHAGVVFTSPRGASNERSLRTNYIRPSRRSVSGPSCLFLRSGSVVEISFVRPSKLSAI
jgi:hypothetical protein